MTYSPPDDVDKSIYSNLERNESYDLLEQNNAIKKEILQIMFMTCRTSLFHLVCTKGASNVLLSDNTKAHAIRKEYFSGFSIKYTISQLSKVVGSC